MNRFYTAEQLLGEVVTIRDRRIVHQVHKVLRLASGTDILLFNGGNKEYVVTIDHISSKEIRGAVVDTRLCHSEPLKSVTLYQSLLKSDKFEYILQKATEIGVQRIIPIVSDRSIMRSLTRNKVERYNRIIMEAVEQCGGCTIPEFGTPVSFNDAVSKRDKTAPAFLCGIKSSKPFVATSDRLSIFIGPEGGFTDEEETFAASEGVTIVSLGKRVLRSETAAIVALARVLQ